VTWGKQKSRFLWLGMKRDSWKISAQLRHLTSCFCCYFLKIAGLAFLPVGEVCHVLKPLKHWEKQVSCSPLSQTKEQGICNDLKKFERWYLAETPAV